MPRSEQDKNLRTFPQGFTREEATASCPAGINFVNSLWLSPMRFASVKACMISMATTKRMKSKPEGGKAGTTDQGHVHLSTFPELSKQWSLAKQEQDFRQRLPASFL
jgi:hypothetical protein